MTPARLKAAHEDVTRIQRSRRAVPPLPGLNDYRAILHAHAEDSAHTGGTRLEMLADAKKAGVSAILLSNHFRPPTDFINESWRGLHDGVLFIPGSEDRGFLLLPTRSILAKMKEPTPSFIETVKAEGGLIFLSHIEERPDHSMAGLNGMEIYNRHADAKKDAAGLLAVVLKLTHPDSLKELEDSLRLYPDELLAAQVEYPTDYLAKWDAETKTRRLTGVAANDCHHNQVLLMKVVDPETVLVGTNVDRDDQMRKFTATLRPGIRALTKGHRAGDILARLDFDPYYRSFQNVSTHVFAPELTEDAIRSAFREGHAYVSHDWMCDPSGFFFELIAAGPNVEKQQAEPRVMMGDEVKFAPGRKLVARFPVTCHIRLLSGGRLIAEQSGKSLESAIVTAGVYRVEGWLDIAGERRPWIYSNPIYVR
ncbi:MAG: histidinol phosphatase [Isosphaerales bacterium]